MMSMVFSFSFAQKEVILKAGTLIPFKANNAVAAADVKVGDKVGFSVLRDVNVDGVTVIPYGTLASGCVVLAKKSSWWGTGVRLTIDINELVLPSGEVVPLENGNIEIKGKNRIALSVVLFALVVWPACFICGSKAEMQNGYEIQTAVASNVTLKIQ